MFCTGCGNKLSDTDRFCKACGTKNIYYNEDTQRYVFQEASAAIPVSTSQPEPTVIQPEVVLLPVEQLGQQTEPSDNLIQMEDDKVIITRAEDEVQREKKPVKEVTRGMKIGSVFLSILAFFMTVLFIISLFAKTTFSQKTLEASIQKIDYTNIQLGDIMADRDLAIDVKEGDTTIDVVYEALSKQGRVEVTRGDVEEIFEETNFTEYISEKLSGYARYTITGAELDEITPRGIMRLVEENKDTIEDIIGLRIEDEDLDSLENYLEDEEILDSFSAEKIDETLKENNATAVRIFFSDTVLMVILILSLLILIGDIVLISFLHRRMKAPLSYIGIPVLTGGLLITITLIVMNIMKASLFKSVKEIYTSIKPLLSSIIGRGILISAITAFLGLLMVAGYIILKKQDKRTEAVTIEVK